MNFRYVTALSTDLELTGNSSAIDARERTRLVMWIQIALVDNTSMQSRGAAFFPRTQIQKKQTVTHSHDRIF